jgi:hypothetical protein
VSSEKRDLTQQDRLNISCGCTVLFVFLLLATLGSIGNGMCETTVFAQSTSKRGFMDARVQMTDCGATTGFSRVVRVQPRWIPRDDWLSCRALILKGEWPVALDWTSKGELLISTPADAASVQSVAGQCYGTQIHLRRSLSTH